MNWSNVRLIFAREIRDQLRDQRTLFMIAVLPILLYPLIGMSFLHVAQFLQQHPCRVMVIGADGLPSSPRLIDGEGFDRSLYESDEDAALITLKVADKIPADPERVPDWAAQVIQNGRYDAVLFFPPRFSERVRDLITPNSSFAELPSKDQSAESRAHENPVIFHTASKERSRVAYDRVHKVLGRWRRSLIHTTLATHQLPQSAAEPFQLVHKDLAAETVRRAVVWSKILPFVLVIWALTGAFYPAIDLCAGEKERGTLETLLSSPALRGEIVWGKLLTIMVFSITTAALNVVSMGITGRFVIGRVHEMTGATNALQLSPPPLQAALWLLLALIPISALFSALSLALAAMSRSTKEGQYYLMPLLLISMPLIMLAMLPAAELNLGSSLIPITGMMLEVRALIEGQFAEALKFAIPVAIVTGACCLLAIRWAIDQFNDESVLFRESERFSWRCWLVHLVRDRGETPTVSEAFSCAIILLLIRFFVSFLAPVPSSWRDMAMSTLVVQLAFIATPALLMTLILTRNHRRTLLLNMPPARTLVAAAFLAILLHPVAIQLHNTVRQLYPISAQTIAQLKPIEQAIGQAPWISMILMLAVIPAICEELAFRGFILSGMRRTGHTWVAILVTSVFFGLAHGIVQQSIVACLIGLVIGYVAVQTGSVIPCIVLHAIHNSMSLMCAQWLPYLKSNPAFFWLATRHESSGYQWPIVACCAALCVGFLYWFRTLPYQPTIEERLQNALDRQTARSGSWDLSVE